MAGCQSGKEGCCWAEETAVRLACHLLEVWGPELARLASPALFPTHEVVCVYGFVCVCTCVCICVCEKILMKWDIVDT